MSSPPYFISIPRNCRQVAFHFPAPNRHLKSLSFCKEKSLEKRQFRFDVAKIFYTFSISFLYFHNSLLLHSYYWNLYVNNCIFQIYLPLFLFLLLFLFSQSIKFCNIFFLLAKFMLQYRSEALIPVS